jgi:ATP-independent RNA helicase DbpA
MEEVMAVSSFSSLGLDKAFVANLTKQGFERMTPIQEASLPIILDSHDIIAQAKTGSGKTLAFGIGVLQRIEFSDFTPQALIIAPTRELAKQIATELKLLAKFRQNVKITTLIGGEPLKKQAKAVSAGTHILIATPGRLNDHIEKQTINLNMIKTLVLDEADRMLDMGFVDEVKRIIDRLPTSRQTLLFSATMSDEVKALSHTIQNDPKEVSVDSAAVEQIEEYYTIFDDKYQTLKEVLTHFTPDRAVIFCTTKVDVESLADDLYDDGYSVVSLQGDLEQIDRDEALLRFSNGSANIMVATDLASRGLDIDGVDLVVNYDRAKDETVYKHRIGRTGRAGRAGVALTFGKRAQEGMKPLELNGVEPQAYQAPMQTIIAKKYPKQKFRAGDMVGTLTKSQELSGEDIGDITITPQFAYVAVMRAKYERAKSILQSNRIKGEKVKVLS